MYWIIIENATYHLKIQLLKYKEQMNYINPRILNTAELINATDYFWDENDKEEI